MGLMLLNYDPIKGDAETTTGVAVQWNNHLRAFGTEKRLTVDGPSSLEVELHLCTVHHEVRMTVCDNDISGSD